MSNGNQPSERSFAEDERHEPLPEQAERARRQLTEIDEQVRRMVQERPFVAMGTALLLGYALGLLTRR